MTQVEASWIEHPGTYIQEELDARGWSQRDLAFILSVPEQAVNAIIGGKRGISPEMAKAMGDAFGVSPEFFSNLQKTYELVRARNPDPSVAKRGEMQAVYPVREMILRRWLENADANMLESQLARFFEVEPGRIPYLTHAARKSSYEECDISPAQLAWLFRVKQIARSTISARFSPASLRRALGDLEGMLTAPEEARRVPRLLAECGVRFVIVEKLPDAKIDGVCFWLSASEPVIGMSIQYDRIDNFWFVLRHEIEHVLRRHGLQREMIDEDLAAEGGSAPKASVTEEERIANDAAAEFCVPSARLTDFMERKHPFYYERDVIGFARTVNRHPGLVVGQMRKRMNDFRYLTRHLAKIRGCVLPSAVFDGWGHTAQVSL